MSKKQRYKIEISMKRHIAHAQNIIINTHEYIFKIPTTFRVDSMGEWTKAPDNRLLKCLWSWFRVPARSLIFFFTAAH